MYIDLNKQTFYVRDFLTSYDLCFSTFGDDVLCSLTFCVGVYDCHCCGLDGGCKIERRL